MRFRSFVRRALAVGILVILGAGCTYGAGTYTKSPTLPPSARPTPIGSAVRGPAPDVTQPSQLVTTRLTLVGRNIMFDKSQLEAKAGTIAITFENQDQGVPHNVHVFRGTDASGESVGMTEVTPGPDTQTLLLSVAPGTYYYHCDVHPTQMTGTLVVTP